MHTQYNTYCMYVFVFAQKMIEEKVALKDWMHQLHIFIAKIFRKNADWTCTLRTVVPFDLETQFDLPVCFLNESCRRRWIPAPSGERKARCFAFS